MHKRSAKNNDLRKRPSLNKNSGEEVIREPPLRIKMLPVFNITEKRRIHGDMRQSTGTTLFYVRTNSFFHQNGYQFHVHD